MLAKFILYLPNSQHVLLFINKHDHEHQNITNNGIKEKEVTSLIQELYKLRVSKPKKILELLDNVGYQVPNKIKDASRYLLIYQINHLLLTN